MYFQCLPISRDTHLYRQNNPPRIFTNTESNRESKTLSDDYPGLDNSVDDKNITSYKQQVRLNLLFNIKTVKRPFLYSF